jgi:hypothetical protein
MVAENRLAADLRVIDRRAAVAALAYHFQCDALMHLTFRGRAQKQSEIGVGMEVDETGGNGETCSVYYFGCFGLIQTTDFENPVALDADIGRICRGTGSIYNIPRLDDEIKHRSPPTIEMMIENETLAGNFSSYAVISLYSDRPHDARDDQDQNVVIFHGECQGDSHVTHKVEDTVKDRGRVFIY